MPLSKEEKQEGDVVFYVQQKHKIPAHVFVTQVVIILGTILFTQVL